VADRADRGCLVHHAEYYAAKNMIENVGVLRHHEFGSLMLGIAYGVAGQGRGGT
jgi:hypothetical protein